MLLASFSTKVIEEAPLLIDSNPNTPVPEKRSNTEEKSKGLIMSKILLRTLDLVGLYGTSLVVSILIPL